MTTAEIARATAVDLPAIMPVMTRAFSPQFGEAWSEAQCLGILALPGSHLIAARDGASVTGFALSRVVLDEAELMLLAVDPAAQRAGLGRMLLDAIVREARAADAIRLSLEVRSGNPAIALYLTAGFTQVGSRPAYYRGINGERFDALTFSLALH